MDLLKSLPIELLGEITSRLDPFLLARLSKVSQYYHSFVYGVEIPRRLKVDSGDIIQRLLKYASKRDYLLFAKLLDDCDDVNRLMWYEEITNDRIILDIIRPRVILNDRAICILRERNNADYIFENFKFIQHVSNPIIGVYIGEKLYELKSA